MAKADDYKAAIRALAKAVGAEHWPAARIAHTAIGRLLPGRRVGNDPLAIALAEAEDIRDAATVAESWTAAAQAAVTVARVRTAIEERAREKARARRAPKELSATPVEDDEAWLLRQIGEAEADLASCRDQLRKGGSTSTAVGALMRHLRELREELQRVRRTRGEGITPRERMERQRDLARRAPDALLEVYVEEWARRRRVAVSSIAALVEGRQ
jgi:hypothetical protein